MPTFEGGRHPHVASFVTLLLNPFRGKRDNGLIIEREQAEFLMCGTDYDNHELIHHVHSLSYLVGAFASAYE